MKKRALVLGLASVLLAVEASAQIRIGVSMALFDDVWLTTLRHEIKRAATERGALVEIKDARNQVGLQLNQVHDFLESGVDAIIVNPVDTDATVSMSDDALASATPLVYVNRMPINVDMLPDSQAFVASNEEESGTVQTQEVCKLMDGKGRVVVIMGELSNQAAIQRTRDIHNVLSTAPCRDMEIVDEQTANWDRDKGRQLMHNWLAAGTEFDAVISNNDEMAIGAIEALKEHDRSMDDVIVAGIDATSDGLAAMQAGDLDVTVFQNARGQAEGAVKLAIDLALNQSAPRLLWIPFELVTPDNLSEFVDEPVQ